MHHNNFDLVRLIAALSVVYFHTIHRLEIDIPQLVSKTFHFIPGVPIFFFISGFLISLSFKRSSSIKSYLKKRLLRIYPALYVCLLLSICFTVYIGYLNISIFSTYDFYLWIIAQMSFVQFYNPDFYRGYGVGTLNGSLWTISVELQFYILIILVYQVFKKFDKNKTLIFLIILFGFFNLIVPYLNTGGGFRTQSIIFKLYYVSFLPWFYMFLIGVYFQENFEKLKLLLEMKFSFKIIYIFLSLFIYSYFGLSPITFPILVSVVFILVYSATKLSNVILYGNDYSYGIYIYHAVVINYFVHFGYLKELKYMFYVFAVSFVLAIFSWHIIEKPVLKLKKGK